MALACGSFGLNNYSRLRVHLGAYLFFSTFRILELSLWYCCSDLCTKPLLGAVVKTESAHSRFMLEIWAPSCDCWASWVPDIAACCLWNWNLKFLLMCIFVYHSILAAAHADKSWRMVKGKELLKECIAWLSPLIFCFTISTKGICIPYTSVWNSLSPKIKWYKMYYEWSFIIRDA